MHLETEFCEYIGSGYATFVFVNGSDLVDQFI
jgi:hypothetical protein